MPFGRALQHERESRDVSLEAVAAATRFPLRHLHALEEERYADLPGGVFNKGILESYCRFLGLQEDVWLERLKVTQNNVTVNWAEFAENVKRNRAATEHSTGRRWWLVLLMLAALAGACWCAWHYVLGPRWTPLRESPAAAALKKPS